MGFGGGIAELEIETFFFSFLAELVKETHNVFLQKKEKRKKETHNVKDAELLLTSDNRNKREQARN